ncbi:hypothetical protein F5141DRAFT_1065946 [Pisolithus sp. B1]|nr:hypothetical protein F5141DRAFT_1065946 [Pisolithus sp. B1]
MQEGERWQAQYGTCIIECFDDKGSQWNPSKIEQSQNFKIFLNIAGQTARVFVRMKLMFMPFQYLGGTHRLQCDVELLLGLGRIGMPFNLSLQEDVTRVLSGIFRSLKSWYCATTSNASTSFTVSFLLHQSSIHDFTFSSDPNATIHHHPPAQPAPGITWDYHKKLTGVTRDASGQPIDPTMTPPPVSGKDADDWGPYGDSMGDIPPWMDMTYDFWFQPAFSLVERLLANTDFDGEFDYTPYRDFTGSYKVSRCYENFMSGDWAWMQADKIAMDPSTHSSTFVPIILSSDKTTVSVATGQNDYWPVYLSIGNIHNNVQHAHQNAVKFLTFLAIPKMAKKYTDDPMFRHFKKQLFHSAMTRIFSSLKDRMTTPQLMKCPNHHFCHVIFGISPYIADYPEQVLVSGILQNWCGCCLAFPNDLDSGGAPQTRDLTDALADKLLPAVAWNEWGVDASIVLFTDNFPHVDICQLLAPNILHQLIKGMFKDHLVEWVGRYLELEYGKAGAKDQLADIDCCIALSPPFPGIHRFPDGHGFSQWAGNDLKPLMKVYLPAIEGHVPDDVVQMFCAFLEFCYIICQNVITDDTLKELKDALW